MVNEMRRLIRGVGLVLGAVIGYQIADAVRFEIARSGGEPARLGTLAAGIMLGALIGAAASHPIAVWFVSSMGWALRRLADVPLRDVVSGSVGLLAGLSVAFLVSIPLQRVPIIGAYIIPIAAVLGFGYLGLHLGIQRREDALAAFTRLAEWIGRERQRLPSHAGPRGSASTSWPPAAESAGRQEPGARRRPAGLPKILDTSAIIDGRIADICRTGFLEGPLLVPRGVLTELQHIADSGDALRRNRGRRGLDVLDTLQRELRIVQVYDDGPAAPGEPVDAQLVRLAASLGGVIVTTDYNLNKVAGLQDIRVLNVNELANAIKPVMLPGEELVVHLIKDGKEAGQGVGYLEDGTMIVVEGGKKHIGETLPTVVTSVLQTVAGRMIFARPKALERDGAPR
ncbi:MAG TPA: PIN domain-containing protein [bacterium]|nr:PIN domain-containing protein [bacterium]